MFERSLPALTTVLATAVLLAPAGRARAGSFDREVALEVDGRPHFEPFEGRARVFVSKPEVVHAEQLPTGEVLLEPHVEGEAVVFLQSDRAGTAWRVVVGHPSLSDPDEALARAIGACGRTRQDAEKIVLSVQGEACQKAAVALSRALPPHHLEVHFDSQGLLAQLAAQRSALREVVSEVGVKLGYLGATLRIKGRITRQELDAAVRAMWAVTAGGLLLDTSDLEISSARAGGQEGADKAEGTGEKAVQQIEIIRGFDEAHPPQ